MYDRAKYLIVSEVAIVKGIPEPEAEKLIEKSLDKILGHWPLDRIVHDTPLARAAFLFGRVAKSNCDFDVRTETVQS